MSNARSPHDQAHLAAATGGEVSNVEVTRNERPQNNPSVQVSGLDPGLIIVTGNDWSTGETRTGVWRSTNGGRSFPRGRLLRRPAGFDATVDPAIDFAFRHRFIIAGVALNRDPGSGQRRIRDGSITVWTSGTDGRSFDGPFIVALGRATDAFNDKPFLSIDKSADSPFEGRAYLTYTRFRRGFAEGNVAVQRSDDGGYSWSAPGFLTPPGVLTEGSRIAWGRQGQVYVSWIELDSPTDGRFRFRRSNDGGVTFGPTVTVARIRLLPICREGRTDDCLPVPGWRFRTPTFSFLGADNSGGPGAGSIYTVWPEFRDGQAAIWLARSRNEGETWSEPIRVSGGGQAIFPNIVVDPESGDVRVLYVGNEHSPPPGTFMDAYVAEAPAGSNRFTRRRISTQSFDPNADPFFGEPSHFIGDYTDMAPLPGGGFVATWMDTRTGNQDIFAGIRGAPHAAETARIPPPR